MGIFGAAYCCILWFGKSWAFIVKGYAMEVSTKNGEIALFSADLLVEYEQKPAMPFLNNQLSYL